MIIPSKLSRLLMVATLASVFGFVATNTRCQVAGVNSQEIPADTLITLERTACFGSCPDYKITVLADGTVVFEGRQFVKKTGTAESVVPGEQLSGLLAKFEEIRFFNLKDQYITFLDGCESEVTDHPSAITSIRTNGKTKTVNHYYGCRGPEVLAKLEKLEQAIDNAVNSSQWIR